MIVELEKFEKVNQFLIGTDLYEIDIHGVIHHANAQPYTYDFNYCSTYDAPKYRKRNEHLQGLRIGMVETITQGNSHNHLDFGCGNGAFLKELGYGYGYDVADHVINGIVKLPFSRIPQIKWYSVSFWDALEHVPAPRETLAAINAQYVFISLPWCHYRETGGLWFQDTYRHRKPNEHLHHFDDAALMAFMASCGYDCIGIYNIEDRVRKSTYGQGMPNILTGIFTRRG